MGIQPELAHENDNVCAIGFCDKEQKWYGWSHRAIHGFGIGSEVKMGDCAYHANNKHGFLNQVLDFWKDEEYHIATTALHSDNGVIVRWIYNDKVPNKDLHGTTKEHFTPYPPLMGRGEWIAKTLDDARQMAIDYAEGVS